MTTAMATGAVIGDRYAVEGELGVGGMGRVYRVRHRLLDRVYALKVLGLAGPAAEQQFMLEAQILAGLAHPGLPRVTDYFMADAAACLVMDAVPGDDLQALLDAQGVPFGPDVVVPWLLQLLEVLAYVHAQGVVHRDVKPANVKITPEGRLVLVDFGIAKQGVRPGATAFGARGFTPYLTAPEQVAGQATGPRTDLYAVGATAAYLLTRTLPPGPVPGALGGVLARAMAVEPGGRWADAEAMRQALRGLAPTPAPSPVTGPMPGRRDIRR